MSLGEILNPKLLPMAKGVSESPEQVAPCMVASASEWMCVNGWKLTICKSALMGRTDWKSALQLQSISLTCTRKIPAILQSVWKDNVCTLFNLLTCKSTLHTITLWLLEMSWRDVVCTLVNLNIGEVTFSTFLIVHGVATLEPIRTMFFFWLKHFCLSPYVVLL